MSAEDNGQVVAEPETEQPRDREGRFADAFAKVQEELAREELGSVRPANAAVEPEQSQEPETVPDEAGEAAEVVAEGPSENMLAVARAMGVDDQTLSLVQNDRDLRLAMQLHARFQSPRTDEERPQPERIEAEPEFDFGWTDDVPPDDPVRQRLEKMHEHYKAQAAKRDEELAAIAEWAVTKGKSDQQRAELARQQEYDKLCDSIGVRDFGESKGLTPGVSPEWHLRNQNYKPFRTMTEELGFTPEQAMQAIALRYGGAKPQSQTPQPSPNDIIRAQSQRRLGGGATRPAPAAPQDRVSAFNAKLNERWDELKGVFG